MVLVSIHQNVRQAGTKQEKCKNGRGANKGEKIPVVTAADTIVEPDTVMVKRLNTIVAGTTMVAARGPPYVACLTVFHRYVHCSHCGGC